MGQHMMPLTYKSFLVLFSKKNCVLSIPVASGIKESQAGWRHLRMNGQVFTVADHVDLWIVDGGSIHIKTREPHGDPVELTEDDAVELTETLFRLIDELRGQTRSRQK
jgi:hypothetical protein